MTNEKEKTCVWEIVPMGDWVLYRAACGVSKYTRDKDSPPLSNTTCSNCGGTVILT